MVDERGHPSTGKGDNHRSSYARETGRAIWLREHAAPESDEAFKVFIHGLTYALEDILLVPGSGGCKTKSMDGTAVPSDSMRVPTILHSTVVAPLGCHGAGCLLFALRISTATNT